jgi:inhibitor of KinA
MPPIEDPRFHPASDQSLLVYLGEAISLESHGRVLRLLRLLESRPIPGVRNLHPAYASLLIVFDALQLRHKELESIVLEYWAASQEVHLPEPRLVEIPVCYGGEFGPDLEDVARVHNMTVAEIVDLHVSTTYLVYFLGFAPGFAYLGELPELLATPRLATPRRKVPAGSVGIAGKQTGIYPFATPGGWRLLGRTPVSTFRQDRTPMNLLSIGDHVRFSPISAERFAQLDAASRACA